VNTLPQSQSTEDRLLVIETKLEYLATKADLVTAIAELRDGLRTFIFFAVAPMYALLIGLLLAIVLFLLPRVALTT
jgi:hypothetical protein